MMKEEMIFKVLWVDDQEEIVESTKLDADEYGIELDHYSNWKEAEAVLRNNFEDYTAIILDAYCQINPYEGTKEEFISAILPSLTSLFAEKNKYIPWYILSAGTMNYFSHTVKSALYQHHTEEWGQMLYIKDAPNDDPKNSHFLYENIKRVGKSLTNNVVLFRHKEVFSYLGKDKLIDERARKLLLRMLSALYYPEENNKCEYEGNPLRKILEYIFRAARKIGVLTDKCFDDKGRVNLANANKYLSGQNIDCYNRNTITHRARWGNEGKRKDSAEGDSVFPRDIAMLVRNTLNYSNSDSHTSDDIPYFIDEQNKELFFGYVMQLCHVIKWFGKFAEENPNVAENKKRQVLIEVHSDDTQNRNNKAKEKKEEKVVNSTTPPSMDAVKGREYLIMRDGSTYYCGICKLDSTLTIKSGPVIIEDVIINDGDDKDRYPYIAIKVSQV